MQIQEHTKLLQDLVRARIQRSIEIKQALLSDTAFHDHVAHVAMQIVKSLRAGGKVMFFGNGGSAADAQRTARAGSRKSEIHLHGSAHRGIRRKNEGDGGLHHLRPYG